ncbi:MAG: potassium-transporting ATPase subunit C [Ignavibacteria bacterium]|nr:potassium-transporting ATPase subunit C [Ignavibacteria bacterium]
MKRTILQSCKFLLLFTLVLGGVYTGLVYAAANVFFPRKAQGSLVTSNQMLAGSELIGQGFSLPQYFHGRPSVITNNPMPSGGSNLGLTSLALHDSVQAREKSLVKNGDQVPGGAVPGDLVFSSGSGVDPHITTASAMLQVERVAYARHCSVEQKSAIQRLVEKNTESNFPWLGTNTYVNVLVLNMNLDKLQETWKK